MSIKVYSQNLIGVSIIIKKYDSVCCTGGCYNKYQPNNSLSVISKYLLKEQFDQNILQRLTMVHGCLIFNARKSDTVIIQQPIRCPSLINGSSLPLIVLDDKPFEGDLETINPKSIESITILKDTAATSIYGVRGANGVIVITTKKGKSKKRNNKVIIIENPLPKNPEAIR